MINVGCIPYDRTIYHYLVSVRAGDDVRGVKHVVQGKHSDVTRSCHDASTSLESQPIKNQIRR